MVVGQRVGQVLSFLHGDGSVERVEGKHREPVCNKLQAGSRFCALYFSGFSATIGILQTVILPEKVADSLSLPQRC
jgi:hypothetical protein